MQFHAKRITCAILSILLAASVLAGCSNSGSPSSSPAGTPATSAATAATSAPASAAASEAASAPASSDLAAYTVNFTAPYPQTDMSDQDQVEAYLNDYLAQPGHLPNTKIHFTFYAMDQYPTKLTLDASSGVKHDLFSGVGLTLSQLVTQGVVSPMTSDMLNQNAPDIMSRIDAKYWPAMTINGQVYGIPNPFVYSQPIGFTFQKSLCDEYNYDPTKLTKLSDMEPFLAQVKAGHPDITPFFPDPSRALFGSAFTYLDTVQSWLAYDTKSGQLEWIYDDPTVQANAATLVDFYKKGYLPSNLSSLLQNSGGDTMKGGKFAVGGDAGAFDATGAKSTNLFGYQTVEVKVTDFVVGTGRVQATYDSLSATSQDPARALMFANYLYKDVVFANMVGYGKEGLDWNYVSGKGTDAPVVKTVDGAKWAIWICWISPLWDQWSSNWNTAEALAGMKQQTDVAPVSPILGFTANLDPIKNQVAQLQQLYDTSSKTLAQGAEGDSAAFLTQLKQQADAAGLQQVLDEINKQISAWKTANGK